jgi:hypothetical protein
MQALSGSLLAFAAGALFYLASPRQQIMATIRRRGMFVMAGGLCCIFGAILWHGSANWPAALCATVAALAASLSGMPFIGIMAGRRAKLASPADANPGTRASRSTGTP